MRELVKMDAVAKIEHAALRWTDDECYYLLEFFPGKRYGFDPDNDLIKNFKRLVERSDRLALQQKKWAIGDVGDLLRPAFATLFDLATTTFVPVPPSRTRSDAHYDGRVAELLRQALPTSADIRELIVCREERAPVHFNETRPSVKELVENFVLGEVGGTVRERIVVFDDVVTSGKHFVACKRFLLEHFPGRQIVGVFVARRVLT